MSFKKKSNSSIFLCFVCLGLFFIIGCVQVKKIALYDGVEKQPKAPKPKDISALVEPIIYADDVTDVWGLEKDVCKEASVTNTAVYSGTEALHINWNRNAEGCDWAGIGFGWDSYAGKDLSEIIDYVGIQMFVRSKEGRMFGLPFVLTFEDYSGGMGFSYTGNKYFERSAIDEEWQKVIVPLNSFEIEKENLDFTNVKSLNIELQQSGSVYLDDIRLVFYEEPVQEPWMNEEVLPNPIAFPIQIFDDEFINNNVWGLISDNCQSIELAQNENAKGQKSVHAKWDTRNGSCKLTSFGVSWNKWHPVDLMPVRQSAGIQLDLKIESSVPESLPISFGFEDYERATAKVTLKKEFFEGGNYSNSWQKLIIPFSAIPETIDFSRVKHLFFSFDQMGEVYIDNIQLVNL